MGGSGQRVFVSQVNKKKMLWLDFCLPSTPSGLRIKLICSMESESQPKVLTTIILAFSNSFIYRPTENAGFNSKFDISFHQVSGLNRT